MQIDVTNGKRFTEYDALAAVASGEDVLLVRLADGTGVKRIPYQRHQGLHQWRPGHAGD